MLLRTHGPIVVGKDLVSAIYAAEELEETAKLVMILARHNVRHLTSEEVAELETSFAMMR